LELTFMIRNSNGWCLIQLLVRVSMEGKWIILDKIWIGHYIQYVCILKATYVWCICMDVVCLIGSFDIRMVDIEGIYDTQSCFECIDIFYGVHLHILFIQELFGGAIGQ